MLITEFKMRVRSIEDVQTIAKIYEAEGWNFSTPLAENIERGTITHRDLGVDLTYIYTTGVQPNYIYGRWDTNEAALGERRHFDNLTEYTLDELLKGYVPPPPPELNHTVSLDGGEPIKIDEELFHDLAVELGLKDVA